MITIVKTLWEKLKYEPVFIGAFATWLVGMFVAYGLDFNLNPAVEGLGALIGLLGLGAGTRAFTTSEKRAVQRENVAWQEGVRVHQQAIDLKGE